MGLPNIYVNFEGSAATAITRSARGTVLLLLEETTASTNIYTSFSDVDDTDYTATNYNYIRLAFLGSPNKVIAIAVATGEEMETEGLAEAIKYKFDYLVAPDADSTQITALTSWITSQRALNKTYKGVFANTAADKEYIINFATAGIKVGDTSYTTGAYTCRIAGILAGLSLNQSATYYALSEVTEITESADPSGDIEDGKLILVNDGEKIKIARAVNSLTTTTATKTADFQKIKIIEGMDLIKYDVKSTFENNYIGKYVNSYDNQVLLISAINAYLKGLEGSVLDDNNNNTVAIDIDAQKTALESAGIDTSEMTDLQIKLRTYSSNVYLTANMKFLDAIEDLQFNISLA